MLTSVENDDLRYFGQWMPTVTGFDDGLVAVAGLRSREGLRNIRRYRLLPG